MKDKDDRPPAYPDLETQNLTAGRQDFSGSPPNKPIAYGQPVTSSSDESAERSGGQLQTSYPQHRPGGGGGVTSPYNGYSHQQPYPPYAAQNGGYAPGHYATGQPVYTGGGGMPMAALPYDTVQRRDEDEAVTVMQWLLAGGLCCCAFPCCLVGCIYGFCCTKAKESRRVRKWASIHAMMLILGLVAFITVLVLCLVFADKWGFYYTHDDVSSCDEDWDINHVIYTPKVGENRGNLFIIGQGQARDIEDKYDFIEFGKLHKWSTVVISPPGLGTHLDDDPSNVYNLRFFGSSTNEDAEKAKRQSFLTSSLRCFKKLTGGTRVLVTLDGGAKYVTPGLLIDQPYLSQWMAVSPSLDTDARSTTYIQSPLKTTLLGGGISSTDRRFLTEHFRNNEVKEEETTDTTNVKKHLLDIMLNLHPLR